MTLPQLQLDEVRRLFREYLKERGQRQTPERFAILEEVYSSADHFDADELFIRMKQSGSRVSRATVYNTLELLMDCDLVVKHQFGKTQAKYERAYAYWQHDHLLCLDCGQIYEFCDPRLQSIQDTIADIFGFEITSHALHIYGHCKRDECPNRATPSEAPR
jgi:Fur family transcriptional regulator, ferric uptake regulator